MNQLLDLSICIRAGVPSGMHCISQTGQCRLETREARTTAGPCSLSSDTPIPFCLMIYAEVPGDHSASLHILIFSQSATMSEG